MEADKILAFGAALPLDASVSQTKVTNAVFPSMSGFGTRARKHSDAEPTRNLPYWLSHYAQVAKDGGFSEIDHLWPSLHAWGLGL